MYKIIRRRFTKAEIESLRSSRYVEHVSACSIRFTEAFKQYFHCIVYQIHQGFFAANM